MRLYLKNTAIQIIPNIINLIEEKKTEHGNNNVFIIYKINNTAIAIIILFHLYGMK